MRNNVWNEMGRTYTKKSSEKHFHTKIADHNYQIADHNYQIADRKLSLVRSGKKCWKREFTVLKQFSQGN
jgi:hypothetical protein